jgi:GMP synthase (glutamine-hydrolysing)
VLIQRAIGDRFHAILIDNGSLRQDEATEVLIGWKKSTSGI